MGARQSLHTCADSLIAAGIVNRVLGCRLVLLIDDPAELAMRGEVGVGRQRALCRAIGMQVRDLVRFDVLKAGAGRPDSRTDASARIDSPLRI